MALIIVASLAGLAYSAFLIDRVTLSGGTTSPRSSQAAIVAANLRGALPTAA